MGPLLPTSHRVRRPHPNPSPEEEGLFAALGSRSPLRLKSGVEQEIGLLRDLCDTMKYGSLCALGGFTPYPVLSALDHFPEDFGGAPALPEAAE